MSNRLCIASTVKTSPNDLLDFVNYHLNIGVAHIYLFFDNPKDASIKILSKYKKITCFKCDSKHWKKMKSQKNIIKWAAHIRNKKRLSLEERQQLNANFALEIAKKKNLDWIIHMDSDELIYSKRNLKEILSKIKKNVSSLRILSLEAVPEKINYRNNLQEISLFKNFGWISRFYYKNKKSLQKYIPYLKKKEGKLKVRTMYFRGHATGKSIISINAKIKNIGMHEPVPEDGYNLLTNFSKEILLLHFECKNFRDWIKKWKKVYKNPDDTMGYSHENVPFLKKFISMCEKNDMEKLSNLYKSIYFVPWNKKIIFLSLGLLKRIRLNKDLFRENRI